MIPVASSMLSGPVVSVFDFDGTLFRSPAPSKETERRYPSISQPIDNKGLGWFHNRRSLSEPYVPLDIKPLSTSGLMQHTLRSCDPLLVAERESSTPLDLSQKNFDAITAAFPSLAPSAALAPDAFDRWFIAPTVQRYVEAKARGDVTAILTGRDTSFTGRIGGLLEGAELVFDQLFLKAKAGTVKFKVDVLAQLLFEHRPSRLVYYDDRPEQATKILKSLPRAIAEAFSSTDVQEAALSEYYARGGGVEVIMVNKPLCHADTLLAPQLETQLVAELIEDAAQKGMTNFKRGQ